MNIESHQLLLKESLRVIERSVQEGPEKNQRSIGFHASAAAIDMLEIHLHREGLLALSATIKHDWFSSMRRANERLKQEFPKKQEILREITEIEAKRNLLVYGKQQARPFIEEYLETFNKLKETLEEEGADYG